MWSKKCIGFEALSALVFVAPQMEQSDDEGDHQPYAKRRKPKGDAKRGKRRTGVDSGDEDVLAGEDIVPSRKREAAKTAEQIWQEMEQRETLREEVKAILKAVMMASAGQSDCHRSVLYIPSFDGGRSCAERMLFAVPV